MVPFRMRRAYPTFALYSLFILHLNRGVHLAVPWEAQFTMDTIICFLTLYRTRHLVRDMSYGARTKMGILGLMLRDGAMYFG